MKTSPRVNGAVAANSNPVGAKRACCYLRVSTGRQVESDLSIPDQRNQIAAFCLNNGLSLVDEFLEAGASATDDNRPAFLEMILRATAKDHPFDVVVIHSYSRFFRDLVGSEMYIRKLEKARVKVMSITQPMGDDPSQIMMRQMIGLFDEHQSRETGKHVKRSMIENAKQGFHNGSPITLGYKAQEVELRGTRVKKKLVIDPVEAETVKLIFQLYQWGDGQSGPLGTKRLVSYLNEHGYRTRRGARFGIGTIHNILTNTTYIGELIYNRNDSKTQQLKDPSEWVTVEVPPIIDRAQFEAVQAALKSRAPKNTPPRVITSPILLSGLAHCATCQGAMTLGSGTSKNKTVYNYYKCSTCAKQGKTACKGRSIRMDKLDTLVTQHLIQRLLTTERLTDTVASIVAQRATKVAEVDGRLQKLQAEVSDAESKLKRLYQMVEEGLTEVDEILKGRIDALKQNRERAQTALDRIRVNAVPPADIPAEIIETFGRMMRENITSGEIPFRKAYLRSVVDRIEVDDEVIRVIGSKATLLKAIAGGNPGLPGVQSFERKWCARRDLNSQPSGSKPDALSS